MKCKNIDCQNETIGKRIYCSLTCRSSYVNKYLRDYTNSGNGVSNHFEVIYNQKPNLCNACKKPLPYEDRTKKYCSQNCRNTSSYIALYGHSEETKKKISNTFRNKPNASGFYAKKVDFCINCGNEFIKYRKTKVCCSVKCTYQNKAKYKKFDETILNNKLRYRTACRFMFGLSTYPHEFDFNLIEKYGWYSAKNHGNNLDGVSRDHKYSVSDGYKNKVDPLILSHPANCQLLKHTENFKKKNNSSITLEQLLQDIKNWNKKYVGMS